MFKTQDNFSYVLCLTAKKLDEQSFLFLELFGLARHFLFFCLERLISLLLVGLILLFSAAQFDVTPLITSQRCVMLLLAESS